MVKVRHPPVVQFVINPLTVRHNMAIAEYARTSISALSGVTAGILGLTGLYGFAFYLVCTLGLFIGLLMKSKSNKRDSEQYFVSRKQLLLSGQFGALFTYILFWTFLYGMVHVY